LDKEKPCSKCGEIYPLTSEYFPIRKIAKDGFDSWCKKCRSAHNKKYCKENKDRITKKNRNYYLENKDRLLKYMGDYQKTDRYKDYRKKYTRTEKNKEYRRLYYLFKKYDKERNNYI